MKKENESELRTMNDAIEEAEKSMGETEIREANLKKAEYLSRIGDKVKNLSSQCNLKYGTLLLHSYTTCV